MGVLLILVLLYFMFVNMKYLLIAILVMGGAAVTSTILVTIIDTLYNLSTTVTLGKKVKNDLVEDLKKDENNMVAVDKKYTEYKHDQYDWRGVTNFDIGELLNKE